MTLIRWTPARGLIGIGDEMARLFDGFFGPKWKGRELEDQVWTPRVNIEEDENKYELTFELPGIEKNDIDIQLEDHVLAVEGEKKVAQEKKENDFHLLERCCGKFKRTFKLPENAETENIDAEFKDGLLRIDIPKAEKAKPKLFKVKVN